MPRFKYRSQLYEHLGANAREIMLAAEKTAKEIKTDLGIEDGGPSVAAETPPVKPVASISKAASEMREIIKDVYGDAYDACPVASVGAAMWLACRSAFAPPASASGRRYRARYITPLEKGTGRHSSYGQVYPPQYKRFLCEDDAADDRCGDTIRQIDDLDAVVVPLEGASYVHHGIAYTPAALLTGVEAESSLEIMAATADVHASHLAGFVSSGYDTPGFGASSRDEKGTPLLQSGIGQLAREFDVPYIMDCGYSVPLLGAVPSRTRASLAVYSLGQGTGREAPALIVGLEGLVTPIRKEAGLFRVPPLGGYVTRSTTYASLVPSPAVMAEQLHMLRELRERPRRFADEIDHLNRVVLEELGSLPAKLRDCLRVTPSYGMLSVELNYEDTWKEEMGIPIFTVADTSAGTHLMQLALDLMGAAGVSVLDASIYITAGREESRTGPGSDKVRFSIRCVTALLQILAKQSGFLE
ncbi:MAG TPA: hypothetical protein GXX23_05405 [Firmicutes bacterium]|nr:hypothetical protein [Candidatus Fermentithermobacillaceae bacterium]